VPAAKVRQLDWWQESDIDGVRLAATPAQHFSGRRPLAQNPTQWASWVILAGDWRVFFSGDSGYFDGFRQIGEKYGPFDLTLLEAGAYNENWPMVHMHPTETIQAHLDLKGKRLLPIHNGTFDLLMHPWKEPFDQIVALGNARGIPILTPVMGEPVGMNGRQSGRRWWEEIDRIKHTEQVQHNGQPGAVHF
jgi:L-ascorbate metabolism protein UlaG (beta-lactamase superfamily)